MTATSEAENCLLAEKADWNLQNLTLAAAIYILQDDCLLAQLKCQL